MHTEHRLSGKYLLSEKDYGRVSKTKGTTNFAEVFVVPFGKAIRPEKVVCASGDLLRVTCWFELSLLGGLLGALLGTLFGAALFRCLLSTFLSCHSFCVLLFLSFGLGLS
jgi:hypothetical protein